MTDVNVKLGLVPKLQLNPLLAPSTKTDNGESYLSPTLQLQAPPILLGNPLIDRLPAWQILIDNYLEAQESIYHNPELYEKIQNGDTSHFTIEEQALYQRYILAREALWLEASTLFSQALLVEDPLESDQQDWGNFGALLNSSPLTGDNKFSALIILSASHFPIADRQFLFNILTADHPEQMIHQLRSRILAAYRELAQDENAWGGEGSVSYYVYSEFLENLIGIEGSEQQLTGLFRNNISSLISTLSSSQVQHYLHMNEAGFIDEFQKAEQDLFSYPIGSTNLVKAYKRYLDLQAIAIARGISLHELDYDQVFEPMPGLSDEDQRNLLILMETASTPAGMDDAYNTLLFEETLELFQRRYLSDNPYEETPKTTLAQVLLLLYQMSPSFGSSFSECQQNFEELAGELGVSLIVPGQVADMEALSLSAPISVSPEGLPAEAIQILQRTGYWDLVKDNISEIYFTSEINEGSYSMDSGGNANPALGRVEIDVLQDGRLIDPWEIAYILVHEAAHIDWAKQAPAELQFTTPDERNAYLYGAQFLERFFNLTTGSQYGELGLTEQLLPDSTEAHKIALFMASAITAGRAANFALGYPLETMDINYFTLPSSEFLSSHNLGQLEDLNMGFYPTDLSSHFVLEPGALEQIVDELGLEESQKTALLDILRPVLAGEATLEVEFDSSFTLGGIPDLSNIIIHLISADGTRHKLSAVEIELVDQGFEAIYQYIHTFSISPNPNPLPDQYLGIYSIMGFSREVTIAEPQNFSWQSARAILEQVGQISINDILSQYGESQFGLNLAVLADDLAGLVPEICQTVISEMNSLHLGRLKRSDYYVMIQEAIRLLQNPDEVDHYRELLDSNTISAGNKKIIRGALVYLEAVQSVENADLRLAVLETILNGYAIIDGQQPRTRSYEMNDLNLMQTLTSVYMVDQAQNYLAPRLAATQTD